MLKKMVIGRSSPSPSLLSPSKSNQPPPPVPGSFPHDGVCYIRGPQPQDHRLVLACDLLELSHTAGGD